MSRLLVIDGNSIMNRAFYGIMGSKMLTAKDGTYTNAIYGFLAILFKVMDDLGPEYLAVAFDLKAPTARHKIYEGYKATRKGMPNELAEQMPIIKKILKSMNIDIIEKEGYEADDILGTLSRFGEKNGLEVTILSGDRDTFQLATDKVTIRIPRTKAGKTETEEFNRKKIIENYGLEPKQLIEVKGLQGDTSDNIPGVPGIGEKTALNLIQKFGSIENLYNELEKGTSCLKGKQKENIESNKDLAILSKTLGTINLEVPIEDSLEDLKVKEWNKQEVLEMFKELKFNRYIEKFNLQNEETKKSTFDENFEIEEVSIENIEKINIILKEIKKEKKLIYFLGKKENNSQDKIIKKEINSISIFNEKGKVYFVNINNISEFTNLFKEIFENNEIKKYGYHLSEDYVILKEIGITMKALEYDAKIAAYILNPTTKYNLESIISEYLNLDLDNYLINDIKGDIKNQINLFDTIENNIQENPYKKEYSFYVYSISKLSKKHEEKLKQIEGLELFKNIEMPLVEILGEMQFNGMYVEKEELIEFGNTLKQNLEKLTNEIYDLCGEKFNINSTQQLGIVLFEKLKLTV